MYAIKCHMNPRDLTLKKIPRKHSTPFFTSEGCRVRITHATIHMSASGLAHLPVSLLQPASQDICPLLPWGSCQSSGTTRPANSQSGWVDLRHHWPRTSREKCSARPLNGSRIAQSVRLEFWDQRVQPTDTLPIIPQHSEPCPIFP